MPDETQQSANRRLAEVLSAQELNIWRQPQAPFSINRRNNNGVFSLEAFTQEAFNATTANHDIGTSIPKPKKSVVPGKYITSTRSYGIEFEINFSWDDADALRRAIGDTYNIVHDGSVRRGLEIVSPVLYGKDGEKQIDKVCKEASDRGATTDETTGLHVHFGASDFFSKTTTEVWPLRSAVKYDIEHPESRNQYIVLHDSVIKGLKNNNSSAWRNILNNTTIPFFAGEKLRSSLDGMSSYPVMFPHDLSRNKFVFKVDNANVPHGFKFPKDIAYTQESMQQFSGRPTWLPAFNRFIIDPKESKNLHVIVLKKGRNDHSRTERLKRLGAFYTVFDDVIASMLPGDRRENDYTRRTNHRMSLEEIRDCNTVSEFLTGWLRFSREEQVSEAAPNARPRGRYCGVNLYALIKQSTIEIRYLGGTIDPQRIKHWVALHHAIIDLAADAASTRGSVDALDRASLIVDPIRKTNLFFKKLRLSSDTETYWRREIELHKDDDEVMFRECVESDNSSSPSFTTEENLEEILQDSSLPEDDSVFI